MKRMIPQEKFATLEKVADLLVVEGDTLQVGKNLEVDGKIILNELTDIEDTDGKKLNSGSVVVLSEVPTTPTSASPTFIYVSGKLYVLVDNSYTGA